MDAVEAAIQRRRPNVTLLNFGSLRSRGTCYQLHQSNPKTRIVVLANRPTAAEWNQILSFGATACISKETQGRDIVNAIHLASRGDARAAAFDRGAVRPGRALRLPPRGADILTPREAEVLQLLQEGLRRTRR